MDVCDFLLFLESFEAALFLTLTSEFIHPMPESTPLQPAVACLIG